MTRRDIYMIALAWLVFWAALALLLWMMHGAIGGPA